MRGYHNFDLTFAPTDDGYQVAVVGLGDQISGTFRTPVSDTELENLVLRVGRTRRAVRRIDPPETEAAKRIGRLLYDAVFTEAIRSAFHDRLALALQQEAGLRVRLDLSRTPALGSLPWEYLYDQSRNRFLSLSSETPLVRYLEIPDQIRPLQVGLPLRVLAIVANPRGQVPLDVDQEWVNIQRALHDLEQRGMLILDRLARPTLRDLQRQLRQTSYHILHFVGHGVFDPRAQDGLLLLEDAHGDPYRVSGQELSTIVHDHRSLRLVLLNVCEGGRSSVEDPFSGIAPSLVQQGIPAVIAMQFEVSDEAAIQISHEFYSAITDGYPVDAALAEARKAVYAAGFRLEWGTPVLYMRAPDGQIFDTAPQRGNTGVAGASPTRVDSATKVGEAEAASMPAPPRRDGAPAPEVRRTQRRGIPRWLIITTLAVVLVVAGSLARSLLPDLPMASTPLPTERLAERPTLRATLAPTARTSPTHAPTSMPTTTAVQSVGVTSTQDDAWQTATARAATGTPERLATNTVVGLQTPTVRATATPQTAPPTARPATATASPPVPTAIPSPQVALGMSGFQVVRETTSLLVFTINYAYDGRAGDGARIQARVEPVPYMAYTPDPGGGLSGRLLADCTSEWYEFTSLEGTLEITMQCRFDEGIQEFTSERIVLDMLGINSNAGVFITNTIVPYQKTWRRS